MSGCHAVITNFYFPRPVTSATEKGSLLVPSHTLLEFGHLLFPPTFSFLSPSSFVTLGQSATTLADKRRNDSRPSHQLSPSLKPPSVLVSLILPGDKATLRHKRTSWTSFALLLVVLHPRRRHFLPPIPIPSSHRFALVG